MLGLDINYIPLVLEHSERIVSYIIDNQVVGAESYPSRDAFPYRAFHLILELAKNEQTKVAIPQKLLPFLQTDAPIPPRFKNDYIIGRRGSVYCIYCIALDMEIQESSTKPILLSNFEYFNREIKKALDYKVQLTARQAFYIFANILTNNYIEHYSYYVKEYHKIDFEGLNEQEDIDVFANHGDQQFDQIYGDLNKFAFQYLRYLNAKLLKGTITPEEILMTSGSQILAFLSYLPVVKSYLEDIKHQLTSGSLLYNQRVLYHTFLSAFTSIYKKYWQEYSIDWKLYMTIFEKQVAKEFPG